MRIPGKRGANAVARASLYCMLVCLKGGAFAATSSPTQIKLNDLADVLRDNEAAVSTFQGRVRQTYYIATPIDGKGRMGRPPQEPRVGAVTDIEFRHDRTRGADYWVRMHAGPQTTTATPTVIERRNGNLVEALLLDKSGKALKAVVPEQVNARYLGHQPENFLSRASIHLITTASPTGELELPISAMLARPGSVWIDDQSADVDGHRCVRTVVISPVGEKTRRVAFVYLGQELGFSIVKVQTMLVNSGLELDAPARMDASQLRPLLAQLESAVPELLTVNQEYSKTSLGIWVPKISTSYILGPAAPRELAEGVSIDEVMATAKRDAMTRHLRKAAILGYVRSELDMQSVILNRPIPKELFEKSLVPDGVPVSNFVLNVHPQELELAVKRTLASTDADPIGERKTPSTEHVPPKGPSSTSRSMPTEIIAGGCISAAGALASWSALRYWRSRVRSRRDGNA